jgi:quinol-cytochrome oxidoreductase complex cytochrome b subunit
MKISTPRGPSTERERARWTRFTFLLHLRPVRLPARALGWNHTFGLGGSCLVLLLLLVFSGTLQMLVYQPVPDVAYDSVVALERDTTFGPLVRGIHYWSANLLVLVALLHTIRVFLTGGHQGPRSFTWVLGAGLLLGVLVSGFTGYLLPWDQLSYWAVTVVTGMFGYVPVIGEPLRGVVLGGDSIGNATLVNFYTVHTTIIPVLLVLLAAWHFWRVRRSGGVVVPPPANDEPEDENGPPMVMFWPNLMVKEITQTLVLVALVLVLAAMLGAPLGDRANPGMSPNPAKAPWYFLGFQELLIHLHPVVAVFVLPLLGLLGVIFLPYLDRDDGTGGVWFRSPRGRRSAIAAAMLAVVATPLLVVLDDRTASGVKGWLTGGLLPLVAIAAVSILCAFVVKRRGGTRSEAVQAVVVLLAVAFVMLTVIGVWFRGAGMALIWPWTGGGS